jgi:hypothetical protein
MNHRRKNLHELMMRFNAEAGAGGGAAATGAAAVVAAGGSGTGQAAGGAAQAAGTGQAAAAAPAPFFKGLYGDDGKIDKTAFDRLPDHLKSHKDLFAKYDSVDGLLSGFANAHSMAVKKAMAPLNGTEPPEIVAERKTLLDTINNVPKDLKGYGITRPDDLPEMFWNEEAAGNFAKIAQKHSLSPAAVKELLDLQLGSTKTEIAKGQQMEQDYYAGEQTKFEAAMQKGGIALEKANDLALRAAGALGIDPKSPVFKNGDVRMALVRAANLLSEDKLVTGAASGGDGQKSFLDQARDIANNPQNPMYKAFHDPMHPDNERVRARWNELYRMHKPKAGE